MSKPLAVCISDVHFDLNTLEIASVALRLAIKKAQELQVPLVIAGDLNNTKAIIHASVANRLLEIFSECKSKPWIIVGNHDLINEKGEPNSLNFLSRYCNIVAAPLIADGFYMLPYFSSVESFKEAISTIKDGSILIMHQGVKGAFMGDYVQDNTSIDASYLGRFRTVISGHYHRHQQIGTVTYIGSPYTITFGEANDGPKGFIILNSDGTFTKEILNLRKHVILEITTDDIIGPTPYINPHDLLMVKVKGPFSELQKLDKEKIGNVLLGHSNFRLEPIPTDRKEIYENQLMGLDASEVFDMIISSIGESEEMKQSLKAYWRELIQ